MIWERESEYEKILYMGKRWERELRKEWLSGFAEAILTLPSSYLSLSRGLFSLRLFRGDEEKDEWNVVQTV